MKEYAYRPKNGGFTTWFNVGDTVTIEGTKKRVKSITGHIAEEDDPDLDLRAGDWYYTVEFVSATPNQGTAN